MTTSTPRKTAADFQPEVMRLFDRYVHGDLSRRGFLEASSKIVAGLAAAEALLLALSPNFAMAQQVAPDHPDITTGYQEFASPNGYGNLRGYLAKPKHANQPLPCVLVVHENRGLNPHIEDITRRLALDNFIAFAPDALFPLGGYPGTEDKARELFPKLDQSKTREDFLSATQALKGIADSTEKMGVVGFCYGGAIANFLATRVPDLTAAVAFYGGAPALEEVKHIKAEMLIHHASKDERLLAGWPKYEAALKEAGLAYQGFIYEGVEHGFNNDTTPRYDSAAATLAWKRTIDLFNRRLR